MRRTQMVTCKNFVSFPVARAEGTHPIPFRTRKLSPPAPMVLHGSLCGRVGHRRGLISEDPILMDGVFTILGAALLNEP